MNGDANIAMHLSIGPNVNGHQNLIGFVWFLLAASGGSQMTGWLSALWKSTFNLD